MSALPFLGIVAWSLPGIVFTILWLRDQGMPTYWSDDRRRPIIDWVSLLMVMPIILMAGPVLCAGAIYMRRPAPHSTEKGET